MSRPMAGGIGPALAGREADYIVGRLTAYRANEMVGAQSALMWGQAAALSDEDIQHLRSTSQASDCRRVNFFPATPRLTKCAR